MSDQFNPKDYIVTKDGHRGYIVKRLDYCFNSYEVQLASGLTVRPGDELKLDKLMYKDCSITGDSPTPETDAEFEGIRNSIKKEHQFDWAIEVARKLERERDEARNKMADALQEVDLRMLDYERMKSERDEARDVAENLSKQGLDMMDENRSLKRERGEARAKIKDYGY